MADARAYARAPRLTLTQAFTLSFAALVALLGYLLYFVLSASQQAIVESSDRLREEASREITRRVGDYLKQAETAVGQIESGFRHGTLDPSDPLSLERGFYALLLATPDLTEVSMTRARAEGYDAKGNIRVSPEERGTLSVFRHGDAILTQSVGIERGKLAEYRRTRPPQGAFLSAPLVAVAGAHPEDPTSFLTFKTPARKDFVGKLLWSDLHYSETDSDLPEARRPARVSVQKAVFDGSGAFRGVVRVALSAEQIDRIGKIKLIEHDPGDPHRVFLCDSDGRLITRLSAEDRLEESNGDLRVKTDRPLPEMAALLRQPALAQVSSDRPAVSGRFTDGGREYLYTFRALGDTQDWIVGIVAPASFYLGKLEEARRRLIWVSLAIFAVIVAGGALLLRTVRRAQREIIAETGKMNRFEFTPGAYHSPFRDISESLESLERAKLAMRAMGKYVPIDLVRKLYHARSEPVLGGETTEVSLMFTDIADFTALSERLEPNRLAQALGHYLDVMVRVIQTENSGTIDKFIGDAIMAMWNAPSQLPDHPVHACRAALACLEETRKLYASPRWSGLPPFETRFGIHRETVMVGHFGAQDRMNYTAIGDGVNLASRLEGLNKQYGTSIIASEAVRDLAMVEFEFRLLDCVAVKGKKIGIRVYELLGPRGMARPSWHSSYEDAFAAYQRRDFSAALGLLEAGLSQDAPSRVLAERCREFLREPPGPDWNGVYESHHK